MRIVTIIGARPQFIKVEKIDPVGYLEMLWLLKHCRLVLTDSGGAQKEAFFFCKPCVTMREQTEWTELVEAGANILTGANRVSIINSVQRLLNQPVVYNPQLYGGERFNAYR